MIKIIQYIKSIFCKHKWTCIYSYGTFALWKCNKCSKTKNGYAPVL